jgi:glutathione S-transferase
MRARMALDVANITIEHREILLRDKPATMLAASPKGTVPVLVTDAGVLDESLDIMNWALAQKDPEDWLVDGPQDRIDAERFLTDFKDKLDRYKYASRYDPSVPRGMVDTDYRREAMTLLSDFSLPLETTEFLRGDRPRLIDVAIFPFVRQFAAVEPTWWTTSAASGLGRWLQHWLESARFERIMTKHSIWNETLPTG